MPPTAAANGDGGGGAARRPARSSDSERQIDVAMEAGIRNFSDDRRTCRMSVDLAKRLALAS